VTKTKNGKPSRKTLEFGQERIQTSEKENESNNDSLDEYLKIDNLPVGGLQVKGVYNKPFRTVPRSCKRSHQKNAFNEMLEYLTSESMLLCNKPDEITGFHSILGGSANFLSHGLLSCSWRMWQSRK